MLFFSKSAANIYPSNKQDFFSIILLLSNQEALCNLNIVLSFQQPFEPITAIFTITGLYNMLYFILVMGANTKDRTLTKNK